MPAGWYACRPTYLSCSAECWYGRFVKGNLVLKCGCGCGEDVLRPCKRKRPTELVFSSKEHLSNYLINKYLTERCGLFRGVAEGYLNGFATPHYRDPRRARHSLGRFWLPER